MSLRNTIKKNLILGDAGEKNTFWEKHQTEREFLFFLILTLLQLSIGVIFYNYQTFGVIHAYGVVLLGLYFAFQKEAANLNRVAYLLAYLVGTEVLWRMSNTPIYWEFGKYAASLIMIVALLNHQKTKIPFTAIIYFLLLVPACFLTLFNNDLDLARGKLSSNMSGPLSLFLSCCFFFNLEMNWRQLRRLLLWLILPIVSIGFTTLFFTVSTADIAFGTESNYVTSGGFGPNQVSSMLGLGAFAAMFCYITMDNFWRFKFYFGIAAVFLSTQSLLTFSRGGMYNALGATVLILIPQAFSEIARKQILPVLAVLIIFAALIFPFLNDFTDGKLQDRFEDTDSSNRLMIIATDIEIWKDNPFFGIGTGEAKFYRRENLGFSAASHTEFARLLSEHGTFGLLAICTFLLMIILNFNRQKSVFGQALVLGFVTWGCLYMLNAGMRLAAPGFVIGLSFITLTAIGKSIKQK